jgi:hypothetical protein
MHTHQSTKRLTLSRFSSRRAARLKERGVSEDAAADDEESLSPDLRKSEDGSRKKRRPLVRNGSCAKRISRWLIQHVSTCAHTVTHVSQACFGSRCFTLLSSRRKELLKAKKQAWASGDEDTRYEDEMALYIQFFLSSRTCANLPV